MFKLNYDPLYEPTLQPRQFPEIGLTRRQRSLWADRGQIKSSEHDEGGWRQYSPQGVFRLALLYELHSAHSLLLFDQSEVQEQLSNPEALLSVIQLWHSGGTPVLAIGTTKEVQVLAPGIKTIADLLSKSGPVCIIQDCRWSIDAMLAAMLRGGNDEQRQLALQLEADRGGRVQQAKRKRGRKIDLPLPLSVPQALKRISSRMGEQQ